ncbi:MAG: acetyl-CoA carboxylase carboxyltransferase subunit alpha [Deltaproteobacteria bacterium]|nr:acetyl-CoA carboxylase carboxyltransferase subunit alpha [Deltaproteobacteria bacterium]
MTEPVTYDRTVLEFERPIVELERKIGELRELSSETIDFSDEIGRLERKARNLQEKVLADLSPIQKVQLSRHPARPYTLDYVGHMITDFIELHGDRAYADDESVVTGLGRLAGERVVVVGHQKGRTTKENLRRNFGMPRPEGYRKARRMFGLAARFGLPVLTFIDTPGAYPGIGAEERGQAEAIAGNLELMAALPVPIIATVIGEGGSGGALAIGVADRILMLEHSTYSVISPEGCASILWRDQAQAATAAAELKLTAADIRSLGVADEVVREPRGGAHRDPEAAARSLLTVIARHLGELRRLSAADLLERRYAKFRSIGVFLER